MSDIDLKIGEIPSLFGETKVDIGISLEDNIKLLGRRNCVLIKEIYTGSPDLTNDPLSAVKHIEFAGDPKLLHNPETAVATEIAKLEVAKERLKLTPKQKEGFDGCEGNQRGAWAFIAGMAETIKNPCVRRKVITTGLAGLEILGLAGCMQNVNPTITLEATSTGNPTVEVFTPTFTPEPTGTPVPPSELTGPESISTTEAYPTALSVDDIKAALTLDSKADAWTADSSQYITDLVTKRMAEWNTLGLNLTDGTKKDYVVPKFVIQKDSTGKISGWDYVLYGKDGGVAQWLQIKNDSTGNWQWGKTDMWDPNLTTVEGESQYSLPDKLSSTVKVTKDASGKSVVTPESADTFDIVFVGKNEILVEFDKDSNPKMWLDETTGKMEWLDGVNNVNYITVTGSPISESDAQKAAGIDGQTVNIPSHGPITNTYTTTLSKDIGVIWGENSEGPTRPPGIVDFSAGTFRGDDGGTKFFLYLIKSDGTKMIVYKDKSGATCVILF